jgi:hypothetical protein
MLHLWYKNAMARARISTTVDEQLLAAARRTRSGLADSALIDEALAALLARNRAVEIDAAYAAYDRVQLDAGDEWGDLASFRAAAGASLPHCRHGERSGGVSWLRSDAGRSWCCLETQRFRDFDAR